MIPRPAEDGAFAPGAGCCAHERYAVARAAALYGRADLGTPKRPVRGLGFSPVRSRDLAGEERGVIPDPPEQRGAAGVLPGEAEHVQAR